MRENLPDAFIPCMAPIARGRLGQSQGLGTYLDRPDGWQGSEGTNRELPQQVRLGLQPRLQYGGPALHTVAPRAAPQGSFPRDGDLALKFQKPKLLS